MADTAKDATNAAATKNTATTATPTAPATGTTATTATTAAAKAEPKYSKRQLLKSKKYMNQRDLINVLLEDDKLYTSSEVESTLNTFLNKKL